MHMVVVETFRYANVSTSIYTTLSYYGIHF